MKNKIHQKILSLAKKAGFDNSNKFGNLVHGAGIMAKSRACDFYNGIHDTSSTRAAAIIDLLERQNQPMIAAKGTKKLTTDATEKKEEMDLVEEAEDSIAKVFGDKSVSLKETRKRLGLLQGYIQDMINTLLDD
jgi:hypothetical protein